MQENWLQKIKLQILTVLPFNGIGFVFAYKKNTTSNVIVLPTNPITEQA
jgi:hypothetical protein